MSDILIISADLPYGGMLADMIEKMGHTVLRAPTFEAALAVAEDHSFDIVIYDIDGLENAGLERAPEIKAAAFAPEIIALSIDADAQSAEKAVSAGVWEYLQKPVPEKALKLALSRALQFHDEKKNSKPLVNMKREAIIGDSLNIRGCLEKAARAARSNANVIFSGETGTGKELFARAVHANSPRAKNNFVVVDCGSLPETLMESLLFGHAKGAFTGAVRAEEGLVKHADGGTLFLDEVGELPLSMQKTFLRVLQERRFRPLGVNTEIQSDFRLVAASNRDLDKMVAAGEFREDLLYRLRSVEIHLPPLRERIEDIELLAIYYVRILCKSLGIDLKGFSSDFFTALACYDWPGNVRELFGALERAVSEAFQEQTLFPNHLPDKIRIKVARASFSGKTDAEKTGPPAATFPETAALSSLDSELPSWKAYRRDIIEKAEARYLKILLEQADGIIKKATRISGLSQPRLYELLRKYRISNAASRDNS